jgi:hypothetical protein
MKKITIGIAAYRLIIINIKSNNFIIIMSEQLDNSVLKDGIIFRSVKLYNFCKENMLMSSFSNFVNYVNIVDKAHCIYFDTKDDLINSIRNAEINDYERIYKYLDKAGF